MASQEKIFSLYFCPHPNGPIENTRLISSSPKHGYSWCFFVLLRGLHFCLTAFLFSFLLHISQYCVSAGVKWVIKADKFKKIKFCCLQSWAAEPYLRLCGLDRKDVLRRFLFVEGPGLYHQASTGQFPFSVFTLWFSGHCWLKNGKPGLCSLTKILNKIRN